MTSESEEELDRWLRVRWRRRRVKRNMHIACDGSIPTHWEDFFYAARIAIEIDRVYHPGAWPV